MRGEIASWENKAKLAAVLFCVAIGLPNAAWSQVDTGTIRGTVTDASGRSVPNALVSGRTAWEDGLDPLNGNTNGEGTHVFPPLRAGGYSVSVSAPGFTKETRTAITLDVQQNAVVDFQLKPGDVATTVEVSAASPLLQTQDASVGQVFTAKEIDTLPLNGRNYTLLAQLTTGTTTPVAETRGLTASGSFVANGVPSIYNTYIPTGPAEWAGRTIRLISSERREAGGAVLARRDPAACCADQHLSLESRCAAGVV